MVLQWFFPEWAGKRNAEDEIEKAVSAKKQKTVPMKEAKKKPPPKKVESSSSEDSSDSEEEVFNSLTLMSIMIPLSLNF
jgi:hypothetical protein